MNPRNAQGLGLRPQDRVDVVSRRGRVRNVELRITETVAPGQVFVPFHYAEANANQLTQSAFDPISREPNYKQSAVRIERAATPDSQRPTANSRIAARFRLRVGSWKLGVVRRAERQRGAQ
jgi:assimilatory nitrate reductase catalytic subunit